MKFGQNIKESRRKKDRWTSRLNSLNRLNLRLADLTDLTDLTHHQWFQEIFEKMLILD